MPHLTLVSSRPKNRTIEFFFPSEILSLRERLKNWYQEKTRQHFGGANWKINPLPVESYLATCHSRPVCLLEDSFFLPPHAVGWKDAVRSTIIADEIISLTALFNQAPSLASKMEQKGFSALARSGNAVFIGVTDKDHVSNPSCATIWPPKETEEQRRYRLSLILNDAYYF